ncbi:MAG: pilus assembly protein PilZ [Desulfuromonas sp.]|uniref:PilZ domain-containing protein n=1 Tax=Desulfuromonas sp. TaxID=892 RepID=UPI000CBEA619|nr:PilZ domain-containing protein [Desulfuromonas sp.]PLX84843.1 MAG: pilus assembly protein PilZ [Desulfuromonas sp.]
MSDPQNPRQPAAPASQRASLRSPIIIQRVKLDDGRKTFFGYAKNISRSGLFIAATNPRQPGTRFQVELPLPFASGRTANCTCEVIWQRQFSRKSTYEPGMGLKFIDLPAEAAEELDDWVRKQAEEPVKP